jgi:hypothetical protein
MEHRRQQYGETLIPGRGGHQKRKKTKQQIALERRRERGAKYFTPSAKGMGGRLGLDSRPTVVWIGSAESEVVSGTCSSST